MNAKMNKLEEKRMGRWAEIERCLNVEGIEVFGEE